MDKIAEKSLLLRTTLEYLEAITNNDIAILPYKKLINKISYNLIDY
jgi:hypothetical protein